MLLRKNYNFLIVKPYLARDIYSIFALINMERKKKTNWFKKSTRVVGMDPITFEEWWRIKINRIQLISVFILFSILLSVFNYLILSYTPVGKILPENIKNRNKQKIEEAAIRVSNLEKQISTQDRYIANLQKVILGEVSIDSLYYLTADEIGAIEERVEVDTTISKEEKELGQQIRISAERAKESKNLLTKQLFLFDPVVGEVSRGFKVPNHPGVDIVTEKDAQIKACLDGVILHSAYSDQDGHTIIIRHEDDIISIYKHAKTVYVKTGTQVKTGQAIGIVGDTGERSTGPHLHFELWSAMGPLDPMKYFSFGK